eukprot:2843787-Amphidinium_carterae.1
MKLRPGLFAASFCKVKTVARFSLCTCMPVCSRVGRRGVCPSVLTPQGRITLQACTVQWVRRVVRLLSLRLLLLLRTR